MGNTMEDLGGGLWYVCSFGVEVVMVEEDLVDLLYLWTDTRYTDTIFVSNSGEEYYP